jgi:hypothetical protein
VDRDDSLGTVSALDAFLEAVLSFSLLLAALLMVLGLRAWVLRFW